MARSKRQPIQREASSEYFNKKTATWEDTTSRNEDKPATNGHATNGEVRSNANGSGGAKANGKLSDAIDDVEKKDGAGLLQLVIAVVGIYASL